MGGVVAVRALLAGRWFRQLFATRLVSQLSDGVFQASLAGAVFFNPDHQTDPKQAAAGFVVLLLPYSLVGPFAGVFLDRWSRRRVLVFANIVRSVFVAATAVLLATAGAHGVAFYLAALGALSVNRFYLSALSVSLPHVVVPTRLVTANAVTTTAGTFVTIVGLGIGLLLRHPAGAGDDGNAVIAATSIATYLVASWLATRFPDRLLGPQRRPGQLTDALRRVSGDLVAGAQDVWAHREAARILAAITGVRVLFGISSIGTLLLYRNHFHDDGALRAGLVGLGQAFAASAVGYVLAAVVTPAVTARIGKPRWVVAVLTLAGFSQLAFGLPFAKAPLLAGALVLGFATQAAKICADTIVQEEIADDYLGRVFSFYDTLFNLSFVAAAVVAAFVLPADGKSYPVLFAISAGYLAVAAGYVAAGRGRGREVSGATAATAA